jgi:uncharacterized membrane protein
VLHLTLARGFSPITMLAVATAAILLTALFYRRSFGMLRPRQWQALLALRSLAIVLVVFLLFEPVLSYYRDLTEKPALVFLLDTSASMGVADDPTGATRFDRARDLVERWWPRLADGFELHLVEFSERASVVDDVRQLPALAAEGRATSLSRALVAAARAPARREDLEAVVLFSDGIHNSARSPLEVAGKMGVPVHTVGVGSSLRNDVSYRDVRLAGFECPERMMLENLVRVTASIEAFGLDGRVIDVILEEEGEPIATQEIALDERGSPRQVTFEFRPTTPGRRSFTVRVPPLAEERIAENNQRSAVALVVEPGIRVLYLEGTLRAEYGAVVGRFLSRDPDLEFCALVQTRPNVFTQRTNIEGLALEAIPSDAQTIDAFDVFILGDIDSTYLTADQQERIVARVRAGGGLLMLGGYHGLGPGGYAAAPIGAVLPVDPGGREIGQVTRPFLPQLTPEGIRHPIFANIAHFFPTAAGPPLSAGLPELDGATRVGAARPAATVLATCPLEPDAMPVLAVQPVDKGRAAVFAADTTRKWQQGPRALDEESPFLQFWGQMVRYLAGREAEVTPAASVTAHADKAHYEPEEPVHIAAVVRDQDGEGAAAATVAARVRGPAGRLEVVPLSAVAGSAGHYRGVFEPADPGPHVIQVDARLEELALEAETLVVEVGHADLEFDRLDLDEAMLSQIASQTGGRYVHSSTADFLIDAFDRSQRTRRVFFEQPLYWPPLFWLLFVSIISLEWYLRRRFQLR